MIAFLAALVEDRRLALAVAGALAVVAGAIAPWAHVASPLRPLTERGLDADGKITILLGTVALALLVAFARLRQRDLAGGAGLAAVVAAGLVVAYEVNLRSASGRIVARLTEIAPGVSPVPGFGVSRGAGLWLSLAGAAALALASLALALRPGR